MKLAVMVSTADLRERGWNHAKINAGTEGQVRHCDMPGHIGKLARGLGNTCPRIVGCNFDQDSTIHHDGYIRSSVDCCLYWEYGFWPDFLIVQQRVGNHCELGTCITY